MVTLLPTSRGRVAVREWRPRSGSDSRGAERPVPLLLLHGFMGSMESWGDLPDRLLPRFHVVAVDLPGHGDSDPWSQPYEIPEVARVMGEVQRQLFGEAAWWLGYSMGARIALSAGVGGRGVRGVLLESGSPGLAGVEDRLERIELDEARAIELESGGLEAFVDDWLRLPLFSGLARGPVHVREGARRIRMRQGEEEMARWLREGSTGRQPPYWEALGGVSVPVGLLVGGEDRKFVDIARAMVARLPKATLAVAEGVGHTVHLEAPEAWVRWVLRLGGLDAGET
jgi:2-succinyl-6-hydroxy-2,4-cyclohexadiene-1-carboxylate synthase